MNTDKVSKLLNMLSTPNDNERAVAAKMLVDYLAGFNMVPADLLKAKKPVEIVIEPVTDISDWAKFLGAMEPYYPYTRDRKFGWKETVERFMVDTLGLSVPKHWYSNWKRGAIPKKVFVAIAAYKP